MVRIELKQRINVIFAGVHKRGSTINQSGATVVEVSEDARRLRLPMFNRWLTGRRISAPICPPIRKFLVLILVNQSEPLPLHRSYRIDSSRCTEILEFQ